MLGWSLIRTIGSYLQQKWSGWRIRRLGLLRCLLNLALTVLAWCILPLESARWRTIRERKEVYFPHIDFQRLRPLDAVRMAIQAAFLLFYIPRSERGPSFYSRFVEAVRSVMIRIEKAIFNPFVVLGQGHTDRYTQQLHALGEGKRTFLPARLKVIVLFLFAVAAASLCALCVTQPLDITNQLIFLVVMWMLALLLKKIRSHLTLMLLCVISTIVSSRYLWWRYSSTLNDDSSLTLFFSLLLVLSETYAFAVMVLSYFQICWVLDRKPYPLPQDKSLWPHVDIFIPSYNEPLEVVKPTVYGAMDMDWPKEKLHVYILDDGNRDDFQTFAETVGVGYIRREKHNHAKAGNINHAMTKTSGEFVAIFDCDHVPTRSFLQMTMGWFVKDKKIGLVQTPHHFYSEDPFERNLPGTKAMPFENALFHDYIQKGNDTWNATMFCGSCAIMRRVALDEVGGIAVETVTEDAHTSLRLNRRGWTSAFIAIPLAAGLSTESLSAHVGQRIRWARGMVQIFRLDCPLIGKGLSLAQRLCFMNAMIHFLHGLPRMIFLLAPLPYMFADIYVIMATAPAIFAFVLPHMIHSTMTNQVMHRGYRYPFLGAVYETVLSWYIFLPTLVALIMPHKGKFNVTVKGGTIEKRYLDWDISTPYLVLIVLNVLGLIVGFARTLMGNRPDWEYMSLAINTGWILYNLVVLGASMAVAVESIQARKYPRVAVSIPVSVVARGGYQLRGRLTDYSQKGASVKLDSAMSQADFKVGDTIHLVFDYNGLKRAFPAIIRRVGRDAMLGLEMAEMSWQDERDFNRCTFCRTDTWSLENRNGSDVSLWAGFMTLCRLGVLGYRSMIDFSPKRLKGFFTMLAAGLNWLISFWPRIPNDGNR